jgi:hypothetical protein
MRPSGDFTFNNRFDTKRTIRLPLNHKAESTSIPHTGESLFKAVAAPLRRTSPDVFRFSLPGSPET